MTAQLMKALLGMPDGSVVSRDGQHRITSQDSIAGQAQQIVDVIGFTPVHHFRSAIMAVTADSDVRVRPVTPDLANRPADMASGLLAGRRLASAQQNRKRPAVAVSYTWMGRKQGSP